MDNHTRIIMISVGAAAALFTSNGHAQLAINWSTIDGGGGTLTNGTLSLSGTIGQPDAGPTLTAGTLELTGGFWTGTIPIIDCPGDTNGDSMVNFTDLEILLDSWAEDVPPGMNGDLNGDGQVNFTDLEILLDQWGEVCN